MTQVFAAVPEIVTVTVTDQQFNKTEYHVAGQSSKSVKEAVESALTGLPSEYKPAAKAKPRKKRATKAEMAERLQVHVPGTVVDAEVDPAAKPSKKVWAD